MGGYSLRILTRNGDNQPLADRNRWSTAVAEYAHCIFRDEGKMRDVNMDHDEGKMRDLRVETK